MQPVQPEIDRLIAELKKSQQKDGAWHEPFETNIVTDAYMIILLRILEIDDEALIGELADRIESRREQTGVWKLFQDEEDGNLSLTIEAYYALLYAGRKKKTDPDMIAARRFILSQGGMKKAKMFTKLMLTVTGQFKWPAIIPLPLEAVLLPPSFPVSIFDLSVYARVHFLPIMLMADKKFRVKDPSAPDLDDLNMTRDDSGTWTEWRGPNYISILKTAADGVKLLAGGRSSLRKLAESSVRQFMLGRLEKDGTLYSYFSSTFFMVLALLSCGHSKQDPIILKAVEGLKAMRCTIKGKTHIQHTTAHVWNTALISYTLQEAGVSADDAAIRKASSYLLDRQHREYGDWMVHNPGTLPGGWGFSAINTFNPDVDDTTAVLRALSSRAAADPSVQAAWQRGLAFTLSMQNDDGGFPAFEKNANSRLLPLLPVEEAKYILTDPSTPDLTGRTLDFFGKYARLQKPHKDMKAAADWLIGQQEDDGSWFGRWGVCYIYGTWAAVTGLIAAGQTPGSKPIRRAVSWLTSIQNPDGGWGESCKSDIHKHYIPLGASTLTQTAWALDALIAASPDPGREIEKGTRFLLRNGPSRHWTDDYPAGQGLADFLYMHYHSYRKFFPLLALAHYQQKYAGSGS